MMQREMGAMKIHWSEGVGCLMDVLPKMPRRCTGYGPHNIRQYIELTEIEGSVYGLCCTCDVKEEISLLAT